MNVHIVASYLGTDRILPRLARGLAKATGWSVGERPDPEADINYYLPYLEMSARVPGTAAALFTHREDVIPAKVKTWERRAADVELRITWARQYEDDLAAYGPTLRLPPPLDRDLFTPGVAARSTRPVAGVSGYTYSGGRKGERLLASVLQSDAARAFDWRATGRGWPVPTRMLAYDRLPAWYRSLDLYVCPSIIEGVPYGPLEALASGVPVVIPRGVGLLDDLPDDPYIVRYDAGDADSLTDALATARDRIAEAAPDRERLRSYTEPYDPAAWIDGHLAAFEGLTFAGAPAPHIPDAEQREEGIYVVAYGGPARTCAVRLLRSIRKHMPDTPVAVASERPLPGADIHVEHPDADVGGRTAKTKMWGLAPAVWQRVLYLDADTELTAPIPFLFDALRDGWELVMTKDVTAPGNEYDLIHSLWRRDSKEHALGWEALGSDRALQLAGGVCAFRRTPAIETFLGAWYEEWHRLGRRDQGALIRALYAHPVRLLVLGNEWNTFQGICREEPAGIIHHRGGPARRTRGWLPGRLDDPSAWRRVRQDSYTTAVHSRGREGVIRAKRQRYHKRAVRQLTYTGPLPSVRVRGRTGQTYIFRPHELAEAAADDVSGIIRGQEPVWEVGDMECLVCGAPDGACKGDDIAANEPKERLIMPANQQPILPRQHSRRGRAGYVGEEDGRVTIVERTRRFPEGGVGADGSSSTTSGAMPVPITDRLRELDDAELTALGLQRIPDDAPDADEEEPKPKRRRAAVKDKARTVRTTKKEAVKA